MKYLVDAAWDAFVDITSEKRKFRGEHFEELVRELLRSISGPSQWHGTSRSWDGGKDFVDRSIRDEIAWAECKMYHAPVSLKIISNTLVMAIVEQDVKRILFFSFSPINENAKKHLARFGARTGKQIQVFDDLVLEDLILATPAALARYFPGFQHHAASVPDRLPLIRTFFTSDVHVSYQQIASIDGKDSDRQHSIILNAPCVYELIIEAGHAQTTMQLQFNWAAFDSATPFELLNRAELLCRFPLSLHPGQIISLPLYLVPTISGALKVPQIKVSIGDRLVKTLPELDVQVSALVRPRLVGAVMRQGLAQLQRYAASGGMNRLFTVAGRSGVGKSRFVEDAVTILLRHSYEIHFFDGRGAENDNVAHLLRNLLCSVWRLPSPSALSLRGEPGAKEPLPDSQDEYGLINEMIYRWGDERLLQEIADVGAWIVRGMGLHRCALVVDNVQAMPEQAIDLVQDILARLMGGAGQALLLLAFNEDELVFNEAAAKLLRAWTHPGLAGIGRTVFPVDLPEFDVGAAEEFLNNLLQHTAGQEPFSRAYPALVAHILDRIQLRPLDLFQFIKGLEDEGTLLAERDAFLIVSLDGFDRALHTLSKDRERLLRWRIERLKFSEGIELLLAAITYFGPMTFDDLDDLAISEDSCEKMVQASILRWTGSGRVDFYHPSLERFFNRESAGRGLLGRATKQALHERLPHCRRLEQLDAGCFALSFDVGQVNAATFDATVALFSRPDYFPSMQNRLAADRLLQHLGRIRNGGDLLPVLSAVDGACAAAVREQPASLALRADLLLGVTSRVVHTYPHNDEHARHWVHLVRQAAGYLASGKGDSEAADKLVLYALERMAAAAGQGPDNAKIRAEVNLLDRRCFFLKNLGRREEAIAIGTAAYNLAVQHGFTDLACLSLIDLGYVEYGLQERNQQLLAYWEQACRMFAEDAQQIRQAFPDLGIAVDLITALTGLLNDDGAAALQQLDALNNMCRASGELSYLLQGLAAKAVGLLRLAHMHSGQRQEHAAMALRIGRQLEDLAAATGQGGRYRSAIYLTGKAHELLGDPERAAAAYRRALAHQTVKQNRHEDAALRADLARLSGHPAATVPALTTFAMNGWNLPLP